MKDKFLNALTRLRQWMRTTRERWKEGGLLTTDSLAFRLFSTTMLLSLIVLPVLGYLLISHHRQTVEKIFDQQLADHLTVLNINLDALIMHSQGKPNQQATTFFENPTFLAPASGWYWQIIPLNKNCSAAVTSPSLASEMLQRPKRINRQEKQDKFFATVGPFGEQLRAVEQIIKNTAAENSLCQDYSVMVSGNAKMMNQQGADFLKTLLIGLTVLGLGMAFATLVQVHYGLAPLGVIRKELADIRSGKTDRLHGDFPAEIKPLSREMNSLIESNAQIIERSRTHVGNLAHALKTPLSVITNETRSDNSPLAQKLLQQAEIMRCQVSHHLDRARMVARVNVIGSVTDISDTVAPLVRVLNRINEDKGIRIDASGVQDGLKFQGEKQDLEEMLGNLLENACIWASRQVTLEIKAVPEPSFTNQKALRLRVMDDGVGLPEDKLEQVLKRGKRLDETKPGSGLGLSIVAELAELYKGRFHLENMPKGGLCAVLYLPLIES